MPHAEIAAELYYSPLAQDAELAELVEQFVCELPVKIAALRHAADTDDLTAIARLAHQLKGAGGSHGFPHITAAASAVEQAARAVGKNSTLARDVENLTDICQRTRSGLASGC